MRSSTYDRQEVGGSDSDTSSAGPECQPGPLCKSSAEFDRKKVNKNHTKAFAFPLIHVYD